MTTWDEAKRRENLAKHGMDLADAAEFDFETAVIEEDRDVRHETRFRAIGWIRKRLCFLVFVSREDGGTHAISLPAAARKERRRYGKEV